MTTKDCPDCGGELIVGTSRDSAEGTHEMFECNDCGTLYELEEI